MRVVLVRPWTDAHAGDGCCSGDPRHGVVLERHARGPGRAEGGHPLPLSGHHDQAAALVGEVYRRLRSEHPGLDVQVVASSNTAFLLPSTFRTVRRRAGVLAALREANRATTAGAVLVDGERVGDLAALGVDGVLREVRARVAAAS